MAKSLRSKFKRKMRSIKRKRVAGRELKKLEATVSKLNSVEAIDAVKMEAETSGPSEQMDTGKAVGINLKTMKKADGSYPVWLSQRKLRQARQKEKISSKMKKKKAKKTR